MFAELELFPRQASNHAERVDNLFFFLCLLTGAVAVLVTVLILYFAVRYRRRSEDERTPRIVGSLKLEAFWTIIPAVMFLLVYWWGANVYFAAARPPDDALEIYVVGKQWMWKIQHSGGQREINELHLPVNQNVKLILTSEDVIHDFFVPEFRCKVDVIPGRYQQLWFRPTRVGDYHLFCSQYCGTNHSGMIGTVYVRGEKDYSRWLNGQKADGGLALEGRKLFLKLECDSCHSADSRARAPVLEDLYLRTVHLDNGPPVTADEGYIRESILEPRAKVVQGWKPIMPSYRGQLADPHADLSEEDALIRLVAFIKTLGPGQTPKRTEQFPPPVQNVEEKK